MKKLRLRRYVWCVYVFVCGVYVVSICVVSVCVVLFGVCVVCVWCVLEWCVCPLSPMEAREECWVLFSFTLHLVSKKDLFLIMCTCLYGEMAREVHIVEPEALETLDLELPSVRAGS